MQRRRFCKPQASRPGRGRRPVGPPVVTGRSRSLTRLRSRNFSDRRSPTAPAGGLLCVGSHRVAASCRSPETLPPKEPPCAETVSPPSLSRSPPPPPPASRRWLQRPPPTPAPPPSTPRPPASRPPPVPSSRVSRSSPASACMARRRASCTRRATRTTSRPPSPAPTSSRGRSGRARARVPSSASPSARSARATSARRRRCSPPRSTSRFPARSGSTTRRPR